MATYLHARPETAQRGGGFGHLDVPLRPPYGGKMNSKSIILMVAACLVLTSACIALSDESDAEIYQVGTSQELDLAIQNAEDGDTITLINDIVLDPNYCESADGSLEPIMIIDKDITMDLNSHSITWDVAKRVDSFQYTLCIFSIDGCKVTFTGNGVIDAEADYNNSYAISVENDAELTIEDGSYYGATTAVQVEQGSLYIHGGTFDLAQTIKQIAPNYDKYIINAIDSNWNDGTAKIQLMGGTYGYDYSQSVESNGALYIAENYGIIDNGDGTYTVGTKGIESPITSENNDVSVSSDNNAVIVSVDEDVDDVTVSANVTVSGGSKVSMVYQGGLTTDGLAMSATEVADEDIPDVVDRDNLLTVFDLNVNRGVNEGKFELTVTITVDVPAGMVLTNASVVFYDDDGTTQIFPATVDGTNVTFTTTHTSAYAFYGTLVEDDSGSDLPYPPVWDDDDDYVPPVVPVQPEDSGDDTVTIVACAAAAVVAALLAAFLIIDRRQ